MANSNPQAIAFTQQYIRGACNALMSAVATLQATVTEWTQESIATVIPNDSNVVQDGNVLQPLTDAQIQTIIANFNTVLATFSANTNLIYNQILVGATSFASQVPA
jgi:hypothetical protein